MLLWVALAKALEDPLKIYPMILSIFPLPATSERMCCMYYEAHRLIPLFSLTNCLDTSVVCPIYSTCKASAFMTLVIRGRGVGRQGGDLGNFSGVALWGGAEGRFENQEFSPFFFRLPAAAGGNSSKYKFCGRREHFFGRPGVFWVFPPVP